MIATIIYVVVIAFTIYGFAAILHSVVKNSRIV